MAQGFRLLITVMVVLFLSCFMLASVEASQSETVTVKVTVSAAISISISDSAVSLGSVSAGSTKASTAAVTVTNNGSGINETYSLSLANPSGWTASQTAAGADTYVLCAAFSNLDTGIIWGLTNHALSITPVACSATKFSGDQNGVSVLYNSTRKLWFQFKSPTASSVSTEQGIVVTITAQAA